MFYKFYTDSTGNGHVLIRQILKRRTWLGRTESLKADKAFEHVSLFWT